MKLNKKKELIARTLKIGKNRILLNKERLNEIKEAITKQDVRDLLASGAIFISEKKGRKKIEKKKRRRQGSIRKKLKKGKANYIRRVRKLRKILINMRDKGKISSEKYYEIRKEIKTGKIKNKATLMERAGL